MAETKDHWSSEAYQHSASFVPKLATKILQWLDPQKDDVILDIGCGDGVINIQLQDILAQGSGSIHGTDASPAMIEAATQAASKAGASRCTFEVVDALELAQAAHLQRGHFTKIFSNAALHWVLGSCKASRAQQAGVFRAARDALAPGGLLAFEMGGLGNVGEMRAALVGAVARRVGLPRAVEHDPWFFPDEGWAREMLETEVGGWEVVRAEREYRPTRADAGAVEGWVRLFGARFFEALEEGREREECIREVVDVLEVVCKNPSGGFHLGYVRLRVLARKL
ncbi:S-adenosyl-L-methionine-dependent methyltransferase [Daldinia caldariorum]|uniref:S-adenosyl-L-methionine-dependent methyltransferase n=1 Tax=Daldinia caldariorum TaxID=326644 RepID=UPI00200768B4|nr:S-adenosyl-L-methionine-dependent methyltransferase [Daldinia caldariorum]KAI1463189.1 S-adenosyl-L-methionine-dependent methyltransferase [Daldinia caldariorum]